jgi:deoxyinosine 3'endonuclease (endonuclease V)
MLVERLAVWRKEQYQVASQVVIREDTPCVNDNGRFECLTLRSDTNTFFGGVDVSFPSNDYDASVAVYVIYDAETNKVVYRDHEYFHLTVPYVSSYLSFREIEPLTRLVEKQKLNSPNLSPRAILVDGNGILHARHAGIACFLGVRTNIPTIGVGKSLYYQGGVTRELVDSGMNASLKAALMEEIQSNDNEQNEMPRNKKGNVLLMDKQLISASDSEENEMRKATTPTAFSREAAIQELAKYCQGFAVKLQDKEGRILASALLAHGGKFAAGVGTKNPIYVSVGHDISLNEAVNICAALSFARIPEPVRQADLSGRELLRKGGNKT